MSATVIDALGAARNTSAQTTSMLRQAISDASATQALLLIPMIAAAQALHSDISALLSAVTADAVDEEALQ